MKKTIGIGLSLVLLSVAGVAGAARSATATSKPISVRTTLDRKIVLPQRIHWLGFPNVPSVQVNRVDFLIDGKVRWTELNPPYTYGDDGNWLVTSWLTPGAHRFTTRVIATKGRVATDTVRARVLPTPPPPTELNGTRWTRTFTDGQLGGGAPAGTWEMAIDATGWRIRDPFGGGNYVDVAYLAPGLLQSRGGIWTRNPTAAEKANGGAHVQEGNGWCPDTNQPVDYGWAITANVLTLTLNAGDRCGKSGESESGVWAGEWTRAG